MTTELLLPVDRAPAVQPYRLIDRLMPVSEVAERHQVRVAAPARITWLVAANVQLQRSWIVSLLFAVRSLPARLRGTVPPPDEGGGLVREALSVGWSVLDERPWREKVLGSVTQPWRSAVRFRTVPAEEFAAFAEPGYARIAWSIEVDPVGKDMSVFRTETRVATTDADSRRRFRRYWTLFAPGILLIRRIALRAVRKEAERRWRDEQREQAARPATRRTDRA